MTRLEALLDALIEYSGARRPEDPAYHARNPLRLQVFDHGKSTGKMRKFHSWTAGYEAGLYDLELKCIGDSRAKVHGVNANIKGLVRAYSMADGTSRYVARFLRKALKTEITEMTPLEYFLAG